jgi:hypothetical protein
MGDLDRATIVRAQAEKWGVSSAIHPEDHIFNFVINHPGFESDVERVKYYFEDGKRSSVRFRQLVTAHSSKRDIITVLEFAAGYGCVTRHLVHASEISLESCDIHEEAIRFLQQEIGVRGLLSSSFPESLALPSQYDVVFALSFFSHMPITTWARWLVALAKATSTGGLLMFTTHGMESRRRFFLDPVIPENGFWFQRSSEQTDLSTDQYGQTIVTPDFCKANIVSISGLELIEMREGYWWDHQDLYVVRKWSV